METFAYSIMPIMKLENGWKVWAGVDADNHLTVEIMMEGEPNESIIDTELDETNMFRFTTKKIEENYRAKNDI